MAEINMATALEALPEKPVTSDIPAPSVPEVAASKKDTTSNVIKGEFGGKREPEVKNQATEQDKSDHNAPDKKPQKAQRIPRLPKGPKEEKQAGAGGASGKSAGKEKAALTTSEPQATQRDTTRPGEAEQVVHINHADLHPFKAHPFQVRDDDAMKALVESVKERGIDQPALVRQREGGGFEIVAGHRRRHAAELAGYVSIPCVIRKMTDDEAVLAMTESNFNQRSEILATERAQALKMQLDAIKRQGAREDNGNKGQRSNEVVADRNKMTVKQVQRYIKLNELVPDLMKMVDEKKNVLNPDMIDGIMMEDLIYWNSL